jgi:hypothetical protein
MAFNPLLPANGSPDSSAEMRGQLTGLFDLIQSIPVGPTGATGPVGPPFTSFVVDSVTSLDPAQPATVTALFDGTNVKLAFGIPRGQQGADGGVGATGAIGPVGPPFTSFVIESVTTLDPALPATVTAVFDGTNVKLAFGIPQGQQGIAGPVGITGPIGATGPAFTSFVIDSVTSLDPSLPPTVAANFDGTNVKLAFGIPRGQDGGVGPIGPAGPEDLSGTARNPVISLLSMAVAGSYSQLEVQQIADKLDELIIALRRL